MGGDPLSKPKALFLIRGTHVRFPNSGSAVLEDLLTLQAGLDLTVTDNYAELTPERLATHDLIINYSGYPAEVEATEEQLRDLIAAVLNGKPYVALNCAALMFKNQLYYRRQIGHAVERPDANQLLNRIRLGDLDVTGNSIISDDPIESLTVTIVDRDHAITDGVPDFEIIDRVYELGGLDAKKMHVLAESAGQAVLFVSTWGKGKVHYNGLGHDKAAVSNPNYQRLIVQGIAWVLDAK